MLMKNKYYKSLIIRQMKTKNFIKIMALPLLTVACTSEDTLLENKADGQFADIAQVDVDFTVGTETRLANEWKLEAGKDVVGLAWLGVPDEPAYGGEELAITGKAYQNHPLYAVSEKSLQPKTSIYVGKYFSYYPYDTKVVNIAEIGFSVAKQPLIDRNSDSEAYNKAAAQSIWISPKFTDVTLQGDADGKDQAGIDKTIKISPQQFTNKVALDLTYKNNTLADVAPSEIYEIEVKYWDDAAAAQKSVGTFTYAPTTEQAEEAWKDMALSSGLSAVPGVNATLGTTVLTSDNAVSTTENKGKFYYNALPAYEKLEKDGKVELILTTTYGKITVLKDIEKIAMTQTSNGYKPKFDGEDAAQSVAMENSFINKLGVTGKLVAEDIDFLTAIMDGMHVKDDAMLQKMLNYFKKYKMGTAYGESKVGTDVKLYLDADGNGEFRLSKTSVELIDEINEGTTPAEKLISIQKCDGTHAVPTKIILTEGGEVPAANLVFENTLNRLFLDNTAWTWNNADIKQMRNVTVLVNEGDLTIGAGSVRTTNGIMNAGTVTITSVANIQSNFINNGTITINEDAEMLAYGKTITNQSTDLEAFGKIENKGVLAVSAGVADGKIINYGYIKNHEGAKTYITTNQTTSVSFADPLSSTNKFGTIELTTATDNISVSNATEQGFIKYTWEPQENGIYVTPSPDVKYNYLIVKNNIQFTEMEKEVKFIEVAGTDEVVITTKGSNPVFTGTTRRLSGFIMKEGTKANIKEGNALYTTAAYIQGTLYNGGTFDYNSDLTTYLGGRPADANNIRVY